MGDARWGTCTLRIWHAEQVFDVNKLLFPVKLGPRSFAMLRRLRASPHGCGAALHAESEHAKWSAIAGQQPYGTALRP